jgi:hypothetical protein
VGTAHSRPRQPLRPGPRLARGRAARPGPGSGAARVLAVYNFTHNLIRIKPRPPPLVPTTRAAYPYGAAPGGHRTMSQARRKTTTSSHVPRQCSDIRLTVLYTIPTLFVQRMHFPFGANHHHAAAPAPLLDWSRGNATQPTRRRHVRLHAAVGVIGLFYSRQREIRRSKWQGRQHSFLRTNKDAPPPAPQACASSACPSNLLNTPISFQRCDRYAKRGLQRRKTSPRPINNCDQAGGQPPRRCSSPRCACTR